MKLQRKTTCFALADGFGLGWNQDKPGAISY
jgi:hypothetical protein